MLTRYEFLLSCMSSGSKLTRLSADERGASFSALSS